MKSERWHTFQGGGVDECGAILNTALDSKITLKAEVLWDHCGAARKGQKGQKDGSGCASARWKMQRALIAQPS